MYIKMSITSDSLVSTVFIYNTSGPLFIKIVPLLNTAPRHEDVLGGGGIPSRINMCLI